MENKIEKANKHLLSILENLFIQNQINKITIQHLNQIIIIDKNYKI